MPSMSATVAEDPVTLAKARTGDREAMHRIYAATYPTVSRFVARRVPPGQVEDIVAETYARALEALPRYQDRGLPMRAWLLRIATNLVIDAQRSGASRTIPVDAIAGFAERGGPDDPSTDWAAHQDARATLRSAFAALVPAQRAAVGLRHLEGLPVAEAAAVLGVSQDALRTLTHRGLVALRRSLAASHPPDAEAPWT